MGIVELALLIPITAIVLGVGNGIIENILKSQERRMEMRLQAQQGQNEDVTRQFAAMQAEIAALRDTSTAFDLSVEHTVQRLEERLARMESRHAPFIPAPVIPAPVVSPQPEETQRLGLR